MIKGNLAFVFPNGTFHVPSQPGVLLMGLYLINILLTRTVFYVLY